MLFASCAAPRFTDFTADSSVNKNLLSQFDKIANRQNIIVDSVDVFVASLRETLVERDAVGERRIRNTESDQPAFNVAISDKYYELYLFRIYSRPNDNYCIIISTAYDNLGCLGLGPAFFGSIRINQVNMRKRLALKKMNNVYALVPDKESAMDMYFISDSRIKEAIGQIRITEIIQKQSNKIAGSKPIVYNIEKVFNDPKALLFVYNPELSTKFR